MTKRNGGMPQSPKNGNGKNGELKRKEGMTWEVTAMRFFEHELARPELISAFERQMDEIGEGNPFEILLWRGNADGHDSNGTRSIMTRIINVANAGFNKETLLDWTDYSGYLLEKLKEWFGGCDVVFSGPSEKGEYELKIKSRT